MVFGEKIAKAKDGLFRYIRVRTTIDSRKEGPEYTSSL